MSRFQKGKHWKWQRRNYSSLFPQRVAYTYFVDEDDGTVSFSFRGITRDTIYKVFSFLCPDNGKGCARNYKFRFEHDPVFRHGYGYRRIGVILIDMNKKFCSLESLCLLIESRFMSVAKKGSEIQYFPMDEFLNLSVWNCKQLKEKNKRLNSKQQ